MRRGPGGHGADDLRFPAVEAAHSHLDYARLSTHNVNRSCSMCELTVEIAQREGSNGQNIRRELGPDPPPVEILADANLGSQIHSIEDTFAADWQRHACTPNVGLLLLADHKRGAERALVNVRLEALRRVHVFRVILGKLACDTNFDGWA
eukprot:CAMPEP_0115873244 /NCGR_PEP_ID=MMETSP0287-20121206/23890_1 /TAXON_ID=412157 /ORGANISM="Chrysochromulina rotalis, Strain UIO044" /LENGTH=149 /DNA_ID=CAMNT_0003328287 /DNA_START=284 /DNA_END=733 /DNA_ORIENTATION=-